MEHNKSVENFVIDQAYGYLGVVKQHGFETKFGTYTYLDSGLMTRKLAWTSEAKSL